MPAAPADEWTQILARTQAQTSSRQHRTWLYISAVTLSAAGLMAFLNFSRPTREAELRLDIEDVIYRERNDSPQSGAYHDWLWLADHVGTEAGD